MQLAIVVNLKNFANCYRTASKTSDVDLLKIFKNIGAKNETALLISYIVT